ncbi:MAG: insulinase family protein [Candidatus Moraniibacteriota bacterium]
MWDPYAEFESARLSNGLTVYSAHWPGRPWESVGCLVHSGAEHDPVGLEGLAHFVEHAVSQNAGIAKNELKKFFKDCGGMANLGITGYPYTQYLFFVPMDRRVIASAFSIFGRMLLTSELERQIEHEREVIIGEFNQRYPIRLGFDLSMRKQRALYEGYWLERFVRPLGNPESVGRIAAHDLQSYYDAHYTPANMSVVAVGGMRLPELLESLSESVFSIDKKGVRTPVPEVATGFALPAEFRHVLEMSEHIKAPLQAGSYSSTAKISGDINGYTVRIMKQMLSETLNEEVREKRAWTYDIDISQHDFRRFHEFSIYCGAFELRAIDDIEEVIEDCIISIGNREDLFERVKRNILASNLMIDMTGQGIRNNALDDLADYQRIISLAENGREFERVTMNDIRNALQWLVPERRWTLITRP